MAKILVADDNSNIQKMVGLALKDQGIDVVAVGNGEAAVRKISDIKPDLVLADVFMPVRNGYEVCKYVKDDPALAHIPVILLVGAFDPLDEQEAQRVGADGVLKKPFVPPDPLISMVKSALTRAGVSYSGASPDATPKPGTLKATDLLPKPAAPPPPVMPPPVSLPELAPTPVEMISATDESFVDEAPVRSQPVRIDEGSQPLAFGSMMETPAVAEEEEQAFVGSTPDFAKERDWRSEKTEVEEEEEEETKSSWRRDAADEEVAAAGTTGAVKDWREAAFEEPVGRKSTRGTWEPAAATKESAETEAAPVLSVATASTGQQSWAAVQEEKTATAVESVESSRTVSTAVEAAAPVSFSAPAVAEPEAVAEKKEEGSSWGSMAGNAWDSAVQKANQLASSWDVTPAAAVAEVAAAPEIVATPEAVPEQAEVPEKVEEVAAVAQEEQIQISESAHAVEQAPVVDAVESPATAETVAEENPAAGIPNVEEVAGAIESHYAHEPLVETATAPHLPESAVENIREEAAQVAAEAMPADGSAAMDDLVAKVLARMSPEAMQAVTREILRPVVEALVRDELKSKK